MSFPNTPDPDPDGHTRPITNPIKNAGLNPISPDAPDAPFQLSQMASPPSKKRSPLVYLVAGLAVAVVAMAAALVVTAGGGEKTPVAASSPAAPATSYTTYTYSPPPPKPKTVEVAFGEQLVMTNGHGDEIHYTVSGDKTYTRTKYGTKPEKGILFGVKVQIEVIAGTTYVYAGDFALVAKDGTAYEGAGHTVAGGLDGVDLNRGQKAAGVVAFDIPNGAQVGARIELRDGFGGGDQGFWTVP